MQNSPLKQKFEVIKNILSTWVIFFAFCAFVLYALRLPEHKSQLIFFALIPITLVMAIVFFSVFMLYTGKNFKAIKKLVKKYGPGEKCAQEIARIIETEKNETLKNYDKIFFANFYIGEMGEIEKALEVLGTINRAELFKNNDAYSKTQQCVYYFLLFASYSFIENDEAVCSIFNEAAPLFNQFYNNNENKRVWDSLIVDLEVAKGNYEIALNILLHTNISNTDVDRKNMCLLDIANIYIRMGRIDEAKNTLKDFDPSQNNVISNKFFNVVTLKLQQAKANS